ncbi:hypothetical protein HRI_002675300 [Hibiscus trionum]|uniref:Uncharacterized protein n=1 Tax=Hibiscus trionum TaxID=183268 RepID=A0A9W7I4Y6_HIBTR|nr:hypothetical protein HRI_002675300 [Hibiscus trionum]
MEDIRREQNSIKEAQSQVRQKLTAIEMECELLQEETELMIQRSALTQLRLSLMFNILKAREEGDLAKAAQITALLRLFLHIIVSFTWFLHCICVKMTNI